VAKKAKKSGKSGILRNLSAGSLQDDGLADEVVEAVLSDNTLFGEVYDAPLESNDVVRAHAVDAIEKITRLRPDLLAGRLSELCRISLNDEIPMVRWHMAMVLGHLAYREENRDEIRPALLRLLEDPSVFVKSWAIVSLSILGKLYREERGEILEHLSRHQGDPSVAVSSKVRKAARVLSADSEKIPGGWVKSAFVRRALGRSTLT